MSWASFISLIWHGAWCTINPGNGDHLSTRKVVKNKVNIKHSFYRATQLKVDL